MGLFIGGTKYKLIVGGNVCNLDVYTPTPITNGIRLLSSDDFILKDINNLYLTVKEDE